MTSLLMPMEGMCNVEYRSVTNFNLPTHFHIYVLNRYMYITYICIYTCIHMYLYRQIHTERKLVEALIDFLLEVVALRRLNISYLLHVS